MPIAFLNMTMKAVGDSYPRMPDTCCTLAPLAKFPERNEKVELSSPSAEAEPPFPEP